MMEMAAAPEGLKSRFAHRFIGTLDPVDAETIASVAIEDRRLL